LVSSGLSSASLTKILKECERRQSIWAGLRVEPKPDPQWVLNVRAFFGDLWDGFTYGVNQWGTVICYGSWGVLLGWMPSRS
jgi:hypothetical protein